MCGKRPCIRRITRDRTVPSPTPASNTRSAGGRGWMLESSSPTRSAITRFSLQVWTKSRYFWRFSKKRKLPLGSRFSGGTCSPRGGAAPPGVQVAVLPGAPPEGRFRHVRATAEIRNLAQDFVVFHGVGTWDGGGQRLI